MVVLRNDLYHCVSGDRTILLDAAAGRYFCLPPAGEAAFRALVAEEADAEQMRWLARQDLLGKVGDGAPLEAKAHQPVSASPPMDINMHPTLASLAAVSAARMVAIAALRIRGFGRLYRHLRYRAQHQPARTARYAEPFVSELAATFLATDMLFGRTDRCLPRSLAFLAMCHRHLYFPSLVIGVRTNPFVAHCWVQDANYVLNDTVDQVRIFTPMMTL